MSQVYAVNHLNVGAERLQVLKTVRVSRPSVQQCQPIFMIESLDNTRVTGLPVSLSLASYTWDSSPHMPGLSAPPSTRP